MLAGTGRLCEASLERRDHQDCAGANQVFPFFVIENLMSPTCQSASSVAELRPGDPLPLGCEQRLCRFYEASSFAGHSRRPDRVVTNPYSASATNVVIASRARRAYQADQFVVSGNSSIMKAV